MSAVETVKNQLMDLLKFDSDFVKEVFLFIVTMGMLTLLIVLFHYSSVSSYVKNNSRCIRERSKGEKSGTYMIQATNEKNEPLYKVTYTPSAKKYQVDCACESGTVMNKFDDIKVYDVRNFDNPVQKINNQICYCNKMVEPKSTTYFTGYPDLLRFMYNGDASFFTSLQ